MRVFSVFRLKRGYSDCEEDGVKSNEWTEDLMRASHEQDDFDERSLETDDATLTHFVVELEGLRNISRLLTEVQTRQHNSWRSDDLMGFLYLTDGDSSARKVQGPRVATRWHVRR